jgi:hypothetical protein
MNNPALYDAVICGVGGSTQNLADGQSQSIDYTNFAAQADLLATAVDALIDPIVGGVTEAEANLMGEIVSGLGMNRYLGQFLAPDSPFHNVSSQPDYSAMARSIVNLYMQLDNILADVAFPGNPLSNVVFVDGGTDLPTELQNGSIQSPFKTITQAMAYFPFAFGGTIIICSGYYDTEGVLPLTGTKKWRFIGIDAFSPSGFVYPPTTPNPSIVIAGFYSVGGVAQIDFSGVNLSILGSFESTGTGTLQFTNCEINTIDASGEDVYLKDSYIHTLINASSLKALSTFFEDTGESTVATNIDDESLGAWFDHCTGKTSIAFITPTGTIHVDPWSYGVIGTVVNGNIVIEGFPIQSITGTTEQEQIDSLVTALVNLHLAVDNRTVP